MNRFELVEELKNTFGANARVLGAWTKRDNATIITAIGDNDVAVFDIDANPKTGRIGILNFVNKVGIPDQYVYQYHIGWFEFLPNGSAIGRSCTMYITDFGDAKEKAYWQKGTPGPRVIKAPEAIRAALVGYLEGIIGTTPPGLTGTVIDYVIDHPGESFKSFEVRLHMADSGVARKQSIVVRLTGTDPYKFELDTVGS